MAFEKYKAVLLPLEEKIYQSINIIMHYRCTEKKKSGLFFFFEKSILKNWDILKNRKFAFKIPKQFANIGQGF